MLNSTEAEATLKLNLPDATIIQVVEYQDLFIFLVNTHLPEEEMYDPFFSVNKRTGAFSDFSIITDGNPEIHELFGL
jgi:hypothetical protein